MDLFHIEVVVAIAPGIACAVLGFVVEVVPIFQRFMKREVYESEAKLDWLGEVVSHSSFYGVAVAGALGFNHGSPAFFFYAVAWFFACQYFTLHLVAQLELLKEAEEDEVKLRFRKTAGMVRSIVRDEVTRHASKSGVTAKVEKLSPNP